MDLHTGLAWTNRFADLGPDFFTELPAQGLPDPYWVAHSPDCAQLLGLPADWAARPGALILVAAGLEPEPCERMIWPRMRSPWGNLGRP